MITRFLSPFLSVCARQLLHDVPCCIPRCSPKTFHSSFDHLKQTSNITCEQAEKPASSNARPILVTVDLISMLCLTPYKSSMHVDEAHPDYLEGCLRHQLKDHPSNKKTLSARNFQHLANKLKLTRTLSHSLKSSCRSACGRPWQVNA